MTLEEMISEVTQEDSRELLIDKTYLPTDEETSALTAAAPKGYIKVASVEANDLAMKHLKSAKDVVKRIDAEEELIKKPLNEARNRVITFFKAIKQPIEHFISVQSEECKQFQLAENKRLEDERKAAIAKALEEEKARQEQMAELTPFDSVPEPAVNVSEVLAMPTKLVTSTGGGLRKKPIDIRVLDVEKAVEKMASDVRYHGFLTLDTKALKAKAQQIGVEKFNEQFGAVVEAFQDSTISNR